MTVPVGEQGQTSGSACAAEAGGSTPLRSTPYFQVDRVLQALRETPESPADNPLTNKLGAAWCGWGRPKRRTRPIIRPYNYQSWPPERVPGLLPGVPSSRANGAGHTTESTEPTDRPNLSVLWILSPTGQSRFQPRVDAWFGARAPS